MILTTLSHRRLRPRVCGGVYLVVVARVPARTGRAQTHIHQNTTMLARVAMRPFCGARAHVIRGEHVRWSSSGKSLKPIAFAFDIDGVLKQGPVVLPEAKRTIRILNGDNPWKRKVPYLFITNSGGKEEKVRAKDLTNDFGTTVSPKQVVQAHTVMRSLVDKFSDKPILMIGGPETPVGYSRQVLEGYVTTANGSYGFRQVYTVHDLQAYAPPSFPYGSLASEQKDGVKVGDSLLTFKHADFSNVNFAAILVFHDSREWGRDIQYAIDIMRADRGVFGTVLTNEELKSRPPIPIFFSHGDFCKYYWANLSVGQ